MPYCTLASQVFANRRLLAIVVHSILRPFDIASIVSLNNNPNADRNVRWNHYPSAVREPCRLIGRGGSLTFHRRFGFRNFQRNAGRQLNGDGGRVEYRQSHFHALLKPLGLIPDDVRRNLSLVVGVSIHEMKAIGVCIKKIKTLVLDECALHLFRRLISISHLDPVGKAPHVDLSSWRSFAWVKAFRRKDDAQLTVFSLDNIALADRACDNSHVGSSGIQGRLAIWLQTYQFLRQRPVATDLDPISLRVAVSLERARNASLLEPSSIR